MPSIWPPSDLDHLLTCGAKVKTVAQATDAAQAKRLRRALYRRRQGQEVVITLDGPTVVLQPRPRPRILILEGDQAHD